MKKETKALLRKLFIGSMALTLFLVIILSSLHYAFPDVIKLWLFFLLAGIAIVVYIVVILFLELYARRKK
ncbi:MAG: hypothetical protein WC344_04710 [Bacilli bacterium]